MQLVSSNNNAKKAAIKRQSTGIRRVANLRMMFFGGVIAFPIPILWCRTLWIVHERAPFSQHEMGILGNASPHASSILDFDARFLRLMLIPFDAPAGPPPIAAIGPDSQTVKTDSSHFGNSMNVDNAPRPCGILSRRR